MNGTLCGRAAVLRFEPKGGAGFEKTNPIRGFKNEPNWTDEGDFALRSHGALGKFEKTNPIGRLGGAGFKNEPNRDGDFTLRTHEGGRGGWDLEKRTQLGDGEDKEKLGGGVILRFEASWALGVDMGILLS